jgi:hypothetical protein
MRIPGFSAEASLTRLGEPYAMIFQETAARGQVVPQWCLPAGLCAKASSLCHDPIRGGQWCDILNRCLACYDWL